MRRSRLLVNSAMHGRLGPRAALAALALVAIGFLAVQASALPAGCDPSRPGVTHGADATNPGSADVAPCLTYAFFGFGEVNLAVSSSGTVMYGGAYFPTPQPEDCVVGAYEISANIAQSTNQGATWDFVDLTPTDSPPPPDPPSGNIPEGCPDPLPQSRGAGDPRVLRDPLTDRVWFHNIGNSLGHPDFPDPGAFNGLCQTEISFTDDGGATWENDPDPPGWFCPAFDFPHLFTAPRTTSGPAPPGAYPNAVYICKSVGSFAPCWKTLDNGGGLFQDFGFPGSLFFATPELRRGTGGIDGTLYGVVGGVLRFSTDEGATWADNGGVIPATGRGVVVDSAGNVYSVGILDGLPHVTYSTDQGATWSTPMAVQAPGVGHAHDPTIAVPPTGPPGPVAVAYIGSDEAEDTEFTFFPNASTFTEFNIRADGVHNGYLVTTDDIFAANPVFHTVQVDSDAEPLLPYGVGVTGNTTTTSRVDYIGVYFDEGNALQIAEILEFFDQSVEDGDLVGSGPGSSAAGRLNALRNMLQAASEQIGAGTPWGSFYKDLCGDNPGVVGQDPAVCDCPIEGVCDEPAPHPIWTNWLGAVATVEDGTGEACGPLGSALNRTDGESPPRDFAQGPAAPGLADRIGALRDRLGCKAPARAQRRARR